MSYKMLGIFALIMGLALLAPAMSAEQEITFHVHLFRGTWMPDQPGLKDVVVMSSSSHPAIEALRDKLNGPQSELTAATIDALIATQDLKTVDEYFVYREKWGGRIGAFSSDVEHELYRFKFVYTPRLLSPERIELKIALYKAPRAPLKFQGPEVERPAEGSKPGKAPARLDRLLDAKLLLDLDSPVIIGMPSGEGTFFMLLYARRTSEGPAAASRPAKSPGTKEGFPIEPPKALHTLIPAYPEELRQQGVQGRVGLQVKIDDKGAVAQVIVVKPLHPYLDFATVQAVRQWTYAPAVQSGKAIPTVIEFAVNFNPETYRSIEERAMKEAGVATAGETPPSSMIVKILEGTAGYCRKLAGALLDFICEETIKEIHYNFAADPLWARLVVTSRETGQTVLSSYFPQWDPGRTQKSHFLCDYLFVRKGDKFEERRIILKDNGRKMPDRSNLLEEKRFTALNPVLAAIQILGRDRQSLFNFRVIGQNSVKGRKAFVLEAIPKSGNTWGVEYAKVWIDQETFQVLQSEIQGIPLEGYEDVLKDSVQFRVRPYLLTTHTYDVEKNGVRFPGRSAIRVEYPKSGDFNKDRTLKLKIDMTYANYKFFTVETKGNVIK